MRILSVFVPLAYYLHFSQAVKSACMAPPVKLGDEATLSCHFETDIGKHQHDVLVYLYKDNNEHPVVTYAWHDGQAKIHTMQGYRIEGHISDYLVIKIANVSDSNAGQYSCIVALSKDTAESCTLKIIYSSVVAVQEDPMLHDVHSSERITSFIVTEKAASEAHGIYTGEQGRHIFNVLQTIRWDFLIIETEEMDYAKLTIINIEDQENTENILHISAVVLGVVLGILVVIFLTILIIAIYKGWICTRSYTHDVNSDEEHTDNNNKSKKYMHNSQSTNTNKMIDVGLEQGLLA